MTTWPVQKAKARLSELLKRAATEGPQSITVPGLEVVNPWGR